ncbi:MAG: dual specificity protein phosphatase family protein [Pseudomonadota bacterium]
MLQSIYEIEETQNGGLIAIMRRPSSDWLQDDIKALAEGGITLVVRLLTDTEVIELGLEREEDACRSSGIEFRSFQIEDRGVPENALAFVSLICELGQMVEAGARVAVHCRAGIGRSGLSAAALLINRGTTSDEAFARVSERRRVTVPDTDDQRRWIEAHAEALSQCS